MLRDQAPWRPRCGPLVPSDADLSVTGGGASARGSHQVAVVVGFVLFVMGSALALTTDPLHLGPGIQGEIKSDESVYVAAALSAAYDHDLTFEQRDLERFEGLYHRGPEGIFLKRGKTLRIRTSSAFPFVTLVKGPDPRLAAGDASGRQDTRRRREGPGGAGARTGCHAASMEVAGRRPRHAALGTDADPRPVIKIG